MAKSMKSFVCVCVCVFVWEPCCDSIREIWSTFWMCQLRTFSHWSSERVQMQLAFGKQSLPILVYVTFNLLLAERSIETSFRGWYPYVRHMYDRALILSEDSLAVSRTNCSVCVGGGEACECMELHSFKINWKITPFWYNKSVGISYAIPLEFAWLHYMTLLYYAFCMTVDVRFSIYINHMHETYNASSRLAACCVRSKCV